MVNFPIAKINLGLNIVGCRADGYHDLETVFYPVTGLRDVLEVYPMDGAFPSAVGCDLKITNMPIEGDEESNLVVRAYNLLASHYSLPRVHAHLYKAIPTQAGLGGGSSDCAYMIRLLNSMFRLGMTQREMMRLAVTLGADCPFFVMSSPAYGEGIGEMLEPIELHLGGLFLCIVRPDIPVSTREAFAHVVARKPVRCCRDIVRGPIASWRGHLVNDFEESVFAAHPEIGAVKERLYAEGALYAAMSGSGSSVFGIFQEEPLLGDAFAGMYCHTFLLS